MALHTLATTLDITLRHDTDIDQIGTTGISNMYQPGRPNLLAVCVSTSTVALEDGFRLLHKTKASAKNSLLIENFNFNLLLSRPHNP